MKQTKKHNKTTSKTNKTKKENTNVKNKNVKSAKHTSVELTSHSDELTNLFKIILIVILLFAVFYGITYYVTTQQKKEAKKNTPVENAVIQYDDIMIGSLLTQTPEKYYVLIEKEEDPFVETYQKYFDTYKNSDKEEKLRIYSAKLSSGFNQRYIGAENHFDFESIADFRVKETVLVKVENGTLTDYYAGSEDILNHLKEITKK